MLHSCGQSHLQLKLNSNGFTVDVDEIENYTPIILNSNSRHLYTSYLGKVTVDVSGIGDTVFLEKYHKVHDQQLLVKVLDASEHNLSEDTQYSLNKLKSLSSYKINVIDNKYYYILTLLCQKKINQLNNKEEKLKEQIETELETLMKDTLLSERVRVNFPELINPKPNKSLIQYKKIYQKVVQYNSPIDVFFNTINYLDFLYKTTGLVSVNNLDSLVSISNVQNLDNAFFTGKYMVYGTGDTSFYPLSSIDVVGHELSHGLVSGTANLEYKGHSGALNESFADIMGTMFEFYMYDKYPQLNGEEDWLIGEDLGINKPFLRSMSDPKKGKQPDKYKGEYYLNPNSQMDFGGVHINSGIPNYCFYLASQQQDKNKVLSTFIKCLKSLNKTSNFIDFRDTLKNISNNDPVLLSALNKVGLNDAIVSDYNPRNQSKPRIPRQRPRPYPRIPRQRPQPYPRIPRQRPQPYPRIPLPYPQPYPRIPLPYPQPYPRIPLPFPFPFPFPGIDEYQEYSQYI